MKKAGVYFLLCCLTVFAGCSGLGRLIKVSKEITVDFFDDIKIPFELTDNYIVIKTFIGDNECDFIFDSGAPSVIFEKDENGWVGALEEIAKLRRLKGADGTKVVNTIVSVPAAKTGFFEAHDWLVRKIHWEKECDFKDGIIGQDILDINRKKLLVDFDEKIIKTINSIEDSASWRPLNAKIKNGYINVFIEIYGRIYTFKFDTGYSGSLIFRKPNGAAYQDFKTSSYEKRYGLLFYSAGGLIEDTLSNFLIDRIFLNENVFVSNAVLSSCQEINENLMGMKFIQNFNFIIDYDNEKVLIKPRINEYSIFEDPVRKWGMGLMIQNGTIIVSSLTVSGLAERAGLLINDEIIAINDVEIGKANPCTRKALFLSEMHTGSKNEILVRRGGRIQKKTIESY